MHIKVLDEGYVEHIESWGHGKDGNPGMNEVGIIEAARQSTKGSFRGWDQDQKLLKYLYEHKHSTPFEFAGMVVEVKAPIMVFREFHRHRTFAYNEMSARYSPLPNENYTPTIERLLQTSTTNKQAQGTGAALTKGDADSFTHNLKVLYAKAEDLYQEALADGVPKELARLCLPVGRYSQMRATANLRNWLAFLTLRMDPNAQWEIRQVANAVGEIIKQQFPMTWDLFNWERSQT